MKPVTFETHAGMKWQRFTRYHFAEKFQTVPVVAAELGQAVRTLPLAFAKQDETVVLSAVMSLTPDKNLYVAPDGRWLGGYVPAALRGYPFTLKNDALYVDEDSGLIGEEGEPIFDESGEPAKPVQQILDYLRQIEKNRKITDLAVNALHKSGILTEWRFKDHPDTGLYKASEAGLHGLDDPAFLALRRTALPIAYAQLFSMANIKVFDKLSKMAEQLQPKDLGFTLSDDGDMIG